MRLEFETIELHNFMSYVDESFDIKSCAGMSLVQGKNNDVPGSKNGSGKSTIMLSIPYALYGHMQNDMKNKNIISRSSGSKDMVVALVLSIDGKRYKIRRGIEKGSASFLSLFEYVDGIEKDITKSTIAETQKFIEEHLVKLDDMMFFRTILLTADQAYNFYKMKKNDKKEFVEKLFDISLFEDMHKAIHKDILSLSKDMDSCQSKLMVLNKNNEEFDAKINTYDADKKTKIDKLAKDLVPINESLEKAKVANEKLIVSNSSSIENDIALQESSYEKTISDISRMQKELNSIELDVHKNKAKIQNDSTIINKHKDVLSKLCNDCKKTFIDHYNLNDYAKAIKSSKLKLVELDTKKNEIAKAIEVKTIESKTYKDKMLQLRLKLKEANDKRDAAYREMVALESQMKTKAEMIKALKNEVNPYLALSEKCKADIDVETKLAKKIDASLRYLKFAENIVSQDTIRKFIIRDLIVLLNNKVKTYLVKLGANYYVKFDEDMDYEFITPTGTCEWGNFSAGERARIMIATSFAFRDFMSIRNGLSSSILVLDEYFDSAIDSLCIDSILSLLKDFSTTQNQDIFVITHRQEVSSDMFNRTILVEKTNGVSKLNVM